MGAGSPDTWVSGVRWVRAGEIGAQTPGLSPCSGREASASCLTDPDDKEDIRGGVADGEDGSTGQARDGWGGTVAPQ